MRRLFFASASVLALGIASATAQEANRSTSMGEPCPDQHAETGAADAAMKTAETKNGPVRDALGDEPVQPGASAQFDDGDRSFEELAEILPVPDVSDRDVEMREDNRTDRTASTSRSSDGREDPSGIIEEGEVVPEGIQAYQGEDVWEEGGATEFDANDGGRAGSDVDRSGRDRLSAESGTAGAWDGPGEGRPFHRGKLNPDRGQSADMSDRSAGSDGSGSEARAKRQEMDRDALGERRERLAAIALRSARHALPGARFSSYEFEIEHGQRVIEIAGTDLDSGRRVEVDVYANGRIHSITEAITLDAVPESVRSAVRGELGRFRVAHTFRTLHRDLDLYYQFAGYAPTGRPATVEIRADGRDMSVNYLDKS